MQQKSSKWEGIILAFFVILSVLFGCAYVIAINFQIPIPWFAIVIVSVLITAGASIGRSRRFSSNSG